MSEFLTVQPLHIGSHCADRVVIRDTCQDTCEPPKAVIRFDYEQDFDLAAAANRVGELYGLPVKQWGGEVA